MLDVPPASKYLYKQGKLRIRASARREDIDYTRILSVEAHEEGRFRDYRFSHKKRDAFLMNAVTNPQFWHLIIAEVDATPVGFLYCVANEYIVGVEDLMTTVYAYYVRKQFRETMIGGKAAILMMRACIGWSRKKNCREVMVHATSGIDALRTDRFLKRTGFSTIGGNYALLLNRLKTT
ncbi:MAG: GNAT family N-acetyltransferase [Pseudomonadota bacterium]